MRIKKLSNFLLLFFILFIGNVSAYVKSSILDYDLCSSINCKVTSAFMKDLAKAIKFNDKSKVASYMFYPLIINKTVNSKNISFKVKDKEEFIKYYETLITTNMKKEILTADLNSVVANYQGIGIDYGLFWLIDDKQPIKIFVINVY